MKKSLLFLGFILTLLFQSCAVVGGIFKAGVWVGIAIVVIIVIIIIAVVSRSKK